MTTRPSPRTRARASARGVKIALVVSTFHEAITERLLSGAVDCLKEHGVEGAPVFRCPGAFELPQVANRLALNGGWDAIVCLGAVIRGETPHFEYVASGAAAGIRETALRHGIPVIFGVLTTETMQQAEERAGGRLGNKGWDAAIAALEMSALFKMLKPGRRRKR